MSRGITSTVMAFLSALRLPRLPVLVEFPDLGIRITNWPKDLTISGKVYTGSSGTHKFTVKIDGLGESLEFVAPSAVIEIGNLDGYFGAMSFDDLFRGTSVTITILYVSGSTFLSTGWTTTYHADADEVNADVVKLRLTSADAVLGTLLPRRTTQEAGCQFKFGQGGCPFRWSSFFGTKLKTCDHGYNSSNGCKEHFPDLCLESQVTWVSSDLALGRTRIVQPKPYGAFPGPIDHSIVRT